MASSIASGALTAMLLVMALAPGGGFAAAQAFGRLVVLGDSLSDTGNAGRFSDGNIWIEGLAMRLGLQIEPARIGGTNFAVGGARLDPASGPDGLRAQADLVLREPSTGERTLHVVFGGANDVLAAIGSPGASMALDAAAASLGGIVSDLVRHGATDILVPNLPDVGITPAVRSQGATVTAEASVLTARFNAAVDRRLASIAASSAPGLEIRRLDVWSMAERLRADPGAFGFVDVTTPCSGTARCRGYLFWDHLHPTAEAHGLLAEAAYRLVRDDKTTQ
jgi:outer membrane lipase/esterase